MRIGERGQAPIPKEIRDQFGLGPETKVEFRIVNGAIVMKKAPKKLNLAK
jgi:AbrB family looped-hinge helix DNA binding protein